MFKNPFSFEGRIRRTEYGLSIIIYSIAYIVIAAIIGSIGGGDEAITILFVFLIPLLWFLWAQGAKRCHDLGNSGWWQLIPLYGLWMLFEDGKAGHNQYGDNPKGIQRFSNQQQQSSQAFQNKSSAGATSYQGGYSGGHNNPNGNYDSTKMNNDHNTSENHEGYKDGDLYN